MTYIKSFFLEEDKLYSIFMICGKNNLVHIFLSLFEQYLIRSLFVPLWNHLLFWYFIHYLLIIFFSERLISVLRRILILLLLDRWFKDQFQILGLGFLNFLWGFTLYSILSKYNTHEKINHQKDSIASEIENNNTDETKNEINMIFTINLHFKFLK